MEASVCSQQSSLVLLYKTLHHIRAHANLNYLACCIIKEWTKIFRQASVI